MVKTPSAMALGFGVFGGPGAWSLQLLASYALAAHACVPDGVPLANPAMAGLRWVLAAISLAMVLVALAALVMATWNVRLTNRRDDGAGGRERFLARSGLVTSSIFVVATLLHTTALVIVGPCAAP